MRAARFFVSTMVIVSARETSQVTELAEPRQTSGVVLGVPRRKK